MKAVDIIIIAAAAVVGYVAWRAYQALPTLAGARQAVSDTLDSAGLYMDRGRAVSEMYEGGTIAETLTPAPAPGAPAAPRTPPTPRREAWDQPEPGSWWNLSDIHGA